MSTKMIYVLSMYNNILEFVNLRKCMSICKIMNSFKMMYNVYTVADLELNICE